VSEGELSRAEVDHVARLARLALDDAEAERYRVQMASILAQFAVLNELNLAQIPPSAGVHPLSTVMESDEPRPSLPTAAVLANAPAVEDAQFKVPPVFEE